MSITREQVADLREGDVVEITEIVEGDVYTHRGPVRADAPTRRPSSLNFADLWLRNEQGEPGGWIATLTVVSRAPRPLYVNHPRTEPVASDVMRRDGDDPWRAFGYSGDRWVLVGGTHEYETDDLRGAPFRLLVDGETGQVVP